MTFFSPYMGEGYPQVLIKSFINYLFLYLEHAILSAAGLMGGSSEAKCGYRRSVDIGSDIVDRKNITRKCIFPVDNETSD